MAMTDMRSARLLWLLWIVVVLPTALLGTLAARTVKTRETLLRQQYAERAGEALITLTTQVRALLEDQARTVATSMGRAIDADGTYEHLGRTAARAAETNSAVAAIVVFMSPWGFVYPAGDDQAKADTALATTLAEAFNRAVADGRPAARGPVGFRHEETAYTLAAIPGRKDLYAGYAIDEPAVLAATDALLAGLRDRRYHTRFEVRPRESAPFQQPDSGAVTVTDSLNAGRIAIAQPGVTTVWQSLADGTTLAAMELPPPLEHIQVTISHPGAAGMTSIRLWNVAFQAGILLLAVIICGGTAVVLRGSLRLARESRRRSELVAGMSHDLKTPVTSMRMLADGLSSGAITDPDKQRRFIDTIAKECERLGDVVDRILYFLRRDSSTVRYADEPVDVADVLEQCAAVFRERMGERVALDVAIEADLPPVHGDRAALAKVVSNLLDNAAKYGVTAADRFVGLSALRTRHRGRSTLAIRVSDHGPGIPAAEQRRVFERFYRVPLPAHSHVGGIGLGLALCRDIIRAHHGRIAIDSHPGNGCTFTVILPLGDKRHSKASDGLAPADKRLQQPTPGGTHAQ